MLGVVSFIFCFPQSQDSSGNKPTKLVSMVTAVKRNHDSDAEAYILQPPSNNHRGLHLTVLYMATSMRGGLNTRKCSCLSVLIASTHSLRAISLRGVCGVGVCVSGRVGCVRVFTVLKLSL